MRIEEAYEILGITAEDGSRQVKLKFRRLMSEYHPDAVGADSEEYTRKAQEINRAYQTIKQLLREKERKEQREEQQWKKHQNPRAYGERNVYMPYHMDEHRLSEEDRQIAKNMFHKVARGKFYWNPEEEEFSLFLKSIHNESLELLKQVEQRLDIWENAVVTELRLKYQIHLFQLLGLQYVKPVECLRKIAEPEFIDESGREVYLFRGYLGAKMTGMWKTSQSLHRYGNTKRTTLDEREVFHNIRGLKPEDYIYPDALTNNRIHTSDGKRRSLGYLSLEEDDLYFCLIPLLKNHLAHVKMIVEKVHCQEKRRGQSSQSVRANIKFFVRLEQESPEFENPSQAEKIERLLQEYEKRIL